MREYRPKTGQRKQMSELKGKGDTRRKSPRKFRTIVSHWPDHETAAGRIMSSALAAVTKELESFWHTAVGRPTMCAKTDRLIIARCVQNR